MEAIRTAKAEKSLAEFIKQAWHVVEPNAKLVWGKHLDAMCIHLEAVTRGEIQNLLITIPPGSTKSITASVMWPAWTWIGNPAERFLTASNDLDLALRDAVASRDLMGSEWYQDRWGDRFVMAYDQNVKGWYKNNCKGFRTALSVGTRVTGKKGGVLLVDDPDDAIKVRSAVERQASHDWWDKGFYNRVNNHKTGRRVVIAQRVDPDDLIGHIKRRGNFVELCLPEEFDPAKKCKTTIGWSDWRTEPGELLRPSMFGPEQVAEAKNRLRNSYGGQHNQNPVNEEGNQFKKEWLRYYIPSDSGQFWFFGDTAYEPREITDRFLTVDPAFTEAKMGKPDPDWTTISAWGRTRCGKLVWLGCKRYRCEMPDGVDKVAVMYSRWGANRAWIEGGGTQKGFFQLCNRHPSHMNCIEFLPGSRGKLDVASDVLGVSQAGRLWLPAADPDFPLTDVEGEVLSFTGTKADVHDDIVTTLSIAGVVVTSRESVPQTITMGGSLRAGPLVGARR